MKIEVSRLRVRRGSRWVLDGVEFAPEPGRVTWVRGPNGCGKSTLLATLAGELAGEGSVTIDGRDVSRWGVADRQRAGVRWLPQGPSLIDGLSATENLAMGMDRAPARQALVGVGLDPTSSMPVGRLSGGERRRVEMARALTGGGVLLLDEPLAGIDVAWRSPLWNRILSRATAGATVVIVDHGLEDLASVDVIRWNLGSSAVGTATSD